MFQAFLPNVKPPLEPEDLVSRGIDFKNDIPTFIRKTSSMALQTVEMHTTGEPTRIVYSGYPDLEGTLLEQRDQALAQYDYIRRALICEPRGHREMYGAVLRPRTELTETREADMGVLFLTNEGYSTMCGHATIALGRLLVDYAGSSAENLFDPDPLRKLERDPKKREMYVRLHAPCGLVRVTVPIVAEEKGGWRTDLTRHISYNSVPSFATGVSLSVQFTPPPPSSLYTPGGEQRSLTFDIAYGGAFYIIARAEDLGLDSKILTIAERKHLDMLDKLTLNMRKAFARTLEKKYLKHPKEPRLEELYGVIVTGSSNPAAGRKDDLAICFFADQQVDRSPTGSGVQARIALAHAKGEIGLNELRFFHSPVSAAFEDGAFTGEAVQEVDIGKGRKGVIVKVSGSARYTGSSTFVVEDDDEIGKGFFFEQVGSRARE